MAQASVERDRKLMGLLGDGARFDDGVLVELPVSVEGPPSDELDRLEGFCTIFDTTSILDGVRSKGEGTFETEGK